MKRITIVFRNDESAPFAVVHVADHELGFRPAYFDFATGAIHLSRFADGRPAPYHLLDGLPEELVIVRDAGGRVLTAKYSLVAGYERNGFFYTRRGAERALREWSVPRAAA